MHSEIAIRCAQAEDARSIALILLKTGWFPHLSGDSVEFQIERIETLLALSYNGSDCRSVYVDEAGVSNVFAYLTVQWLPYLFLSAPEGYISEIFVHDGLRGKGIGKSLIETAERESRERGCSRLMLCNARDRDSCQRGVYQKFGLQERESIANFILKL
ncbi:MAG: GNAT family N-acetyltransferase [Chlorobaculum sp.]|nr:GNAT family N-acetyltransferase [Chlorobaculum sp.]